MAKGSAAFILTLIGSIFSLIIGLVAGASLMFTWITAGNSIVGILIGLLLLIFPILSLISAIKINSDDYEQVRKWSIAAIIFGILSFGNLLIILGGILGLTQNKQQ